MSDYEIKELIAKKEQKIEQLKAAQNKNIGGLVAFESLIIIGFIIAAVWAFSQGVYSYGLGVLFLFIALGLFIMTIIVAVKASNRKKNGPAIIAKLESQIQELNSQLSENKRRENIVYRAPQSSTDNIDLLLKYKTLLDKNIITQEEFDAKKRELLNLPRDNNNS